MLKTLKLHSVFDPSFGFHQTSSTVAKLTCSLLGSQGLSGPLLYWPDIAEGLLHGMGPEDRLFLSLFPNGTLQQHFLTGNCSMLDEVSVKFLLS